MVCGQIDPNNINYFYMIYVHGPNPKKGVIGGVSGYGTGPPSFSFLIKPQKVLAWGGTEVCQVEFDGLTARGLTV